MTYSGLQQPSATATASPTASGDAASGGRTNAPRIALWVVLALSAVGNTVVSITGAGIGPHLLFGAITALSAVALGVGFMRNRRQAEG